MFSSVSTASNKQLPQLSAYRRHIEHSSAHSLVRLSCCGFTVENSREKEVCFKSCTSVPRTYKVHTH